MTLLLTPSPAVLVNDRGAPVPSPVLVTRLRRVDPALGVRWMANLDRSCWAVTWEWPESDRRWQRVREGDMPREAAYDILGYLPPSCSADEAAPYIESHLKSYPKEEISRLREKVAHWNSTEVPNQQVQEVITDALDDAGRAARAPKGQIISVPSGRPKGKRP